MWVMTRFQPTVEGREQIPSRQRRLNQGGADSSIVADATRANHPTLIRGLKPTAKFKSRYAAKEDCKSPSDLNIHLQTALISRLPILVFFFSLFVFRGAIALAR